MRSSAACVFLVWALAACEGSRDAPEPDQWRLTGTGPPGARVYVEVERWGRRAPLASTVVAESGSYAIDLEALRAWPASQRRWARLVFDGVAAGYDLERHRVDMPVQATKRWSPTWDFELDRGHVCEGRVVDRSGDAVAHARVRVGSTGAHAAADGTFRIRLVMPRPWVLHAWSPVSGRAEKRFDPDGCALGDVELSPGLTAEGVVVYPDGTPLPGAYVEFLPGGRLVTNDAGRFHARGLEKLALTLSVIGGPAVVANPPWKGSVTVDQPRVHVRVLDAGGAPIAGVPVSFNDKVVYSRTDGVADAYVARGTRVRVAVGAIEQVVVPDSLRDYPVTLTLR